MTNRRRMQTPLGRRIWSLRGNMTQRQLAALAGVSEDGLKAIEQGRSVDPRLSTVRRIAAALGVTVADLIEGCQEQDR